MARPALLALFLLGLGAPACRTTRTERPHVEGRPPRFLSVRPAVYEIRVGKEERGFLVRYASPEGEGVWIVRNRWHQDLGIVDELGRAWRFEPHSEEPHWLGSGSVAQGVRRILSLKEDPRLERLSQESLAASLNELQRLAARPREAGAR